MLRAEMAAAGIGQSSLALTEIESEGEAAGRGFPGSPTILVRGEDIQAPDPVQAIGLTCRVYRRRDGRVSPLPDPEDLKEALAEVRTSE
jgi:hypothetical protein